MKQATGRSQIVRIAPALLIGLLVMTAPSCVKPPPPPPELPSAEETPPSPPPREIPTEQLPPEPLAPPREAEPAVEDLDDTIRKQNAGREFLKTIHFDFDQSDIRDDQVPLLQANAAWLRAHAQYKVLVEGHCDERDTIDYNLALGDRRARAVMQYLIDLGTSPGRMRTLSYGEERPLDPGHDETAWAMNRRAEFTLEK